MSEPKIPLENFVQLALNQIQKAQAKGDKHETIRLLRVFAEGLLKSASDIEKTLPS